AAVRWAVSAGDRAAVRHYAAFVALTGKLDEQIPRWQARAAAPAAPPSPRPRDAEPGPRESAVILAYLARVKGDVALARRAAEQAAFPELVEAALFDAGAWAELATRPVPNQVSGPTAVGLRAIYRERAGQTDEADAARKEL